MKNISFLFFKRFLFSKNAGSVTKTISWLCLGGISVSVMAMVVVISVMGGFGQAIEERLLNFEPHLVISSKIQDSRIAKNNLVSLIEKFKQDKNVESFLFDQEQVIFRTPSGNYSGAVAKGMEERSLRHFIRASQEFSEQNVKRFTWDQKDDPEIVIGENDILVGHDLSVMTGVYPGTALVVTPPESLLLPKGEIPEVAKMYVQDILRTGFQGIDTQILLYKKRPRGSLFSDSLSRESLIEVYLKDISKMDQLIATLDSEKFHVQTWKERNSSLFYSLKMEKLLISIFLFLAVLIGSFTIVTILVLLITQKRKDIGILMAIGMKKKNIIQIFSRIGFYLSGLGVFLGFIVGLLICILISQQNFIELPDFYQDRSLPVKFEYTAYVLILGLSLFVSFVSSYYPSKLISTISPQDIFRSKGMR